MIMVNVVIIIMLARTAVLRSLNGHKKDVQIDDTFQLIFNGILLDLEWKVKLRHFSSNQKYQYQT